MNGHLIKHSPIRLLVYSLLILIASSCSLFTKPVIEEVGCAVVEAKVIKPGIAPKMYQKLSDTCELVDDPDSLAQGSYFLDPTCEKPFEFFGKDFRTYCKQELASSKERDAFVGNPSAWAPFLPNPTEETQSKAKYETPWTLSQGARLPMVIIDQTKHQRPFINTNLIGNF